MAEEETGPSASDSSVLLQQERGWQGLSKEGMAQALREAEEALETQTSRGLIVVSALLGIAGRLASLGLLTGLDEGAAAELRALHTDLKLNTNSVLDAVCHIRNLPKSWLRLQ
jgi:hypothetical protein